MTDSKTLQIADSKTHRFRVRGAKLVRVELLEGAEDKFLTADADQFVNLDDDWKWVDSTTVSSSDRLGHEPRIFVEFDLPGVSKFKLKLIGDGGNTEYTDEEKSRNSRFCHLEEETDYQTESNGKVVITDASVGAAGLNSFYVHCEDKSGGSDNSVILTNKRKMFIQEIKMKGEVGDDAASDVNTVVAEYAKQGYELETLGRAEMVSMENIDVNDSNTYKNNVRAAYAETDGKKKEPHTLVIGYTGHLAVKTEGREIIKKNVEVGPGKAAVDIGIAGPGKTNPTVRAKYLWQNIVSGEGWFEDAYFQQKRGLRGFFAIKDKIPESLCTAVPLNAGNPHMSRKVRIDVSKMKSRSSGKIVLVVSWVDRMRAGLSFGGNGLICICTKGWWRKKDTAAQNQVVIHEMGHKIGMVPSGAGSLPDKPPTFYDSDKGHVGTHCHHGIPSGQGRYDSAADSNLSDCVMYGATNGHSAFCDHCSESAKKQVVDDGWSTV